MAATLTPTEDQVFAALWDWVTSLALPLGLDTNGAPQLFKGFQNNTAEAIGNRIVMSPGIAIRQNQVQHTYDINGATVTEQRSTTYSYQVDCYGQGAPDLANTVSIAWRTMRACDALEGTPITPLYADEPVQLNFTTGENLYEQRFMTKLYMQVNQLVTQDQDFFTAPVPIDIAPPADNLPVT